MFKKKRQNQIDLLEQRDSIRASMKKALAEDNMAEYHRLNGHLVWLDKKIRKGKNELA